MPERDTQEDNGRMSDFNRDSGLSALTEIESVACPYCWESVDLVIDLSVPEQSYTEDCHVCCRPIIVSYTTDGTEVNGISVRPENE